MQDGGDSLRVLLTSLALWGERDSDWRLIDLALQLWRSGHRPTVYVSEMTELSRGLRARGIPTHDDIGAVAEEPDIIHGHHNAAAVPALARFPAVPAVFACDDYFAWHDVPPLLPSIRRYLTADESVARRLVDGGLPRERVAIVRDTVDLRRYPGRVAALPPRPERALAYTAKPELLRGIHAASEASGIELAMLSVRDDVELPQRRLAPYDLVFCSGLAAQKAMAAGAGVIVCDPRGLAGFVTPERFDEWSAHAFGTAILTVPLTIESFGRAIESFDAQAAAAVSARLREPSDRPSFLAANVAIYRACIAEGVPARDRAQASLALATYVERWAPKASDAWPWMQERLQLVRERDAAYARPARLIVGERASLGKGQPPVLDYVRGFSTQEEWGLWTDGSKATVLVRLDACDGEAELALQCMAYVPPRNPRLYVDVEANGKNVATWVFSEPELTEFRSFVVALPATGKGLVMLTLHLRTPRSPKELERHEDARRLGLAISAVHFRSFTKTVDLGSDESD